MARLNQSLDSDDEFPELSILLLRSVEDRGDRVLEKSKDESDGSTHKDEPLNRDRICLNYIQLPNGEKHPSKSLPLKPLKPANVHSQHFPIPNHEPENWTNPSRTDATTRVSPKRRAKAHVDYSKFAPNLSESRASISSFSGTDSSTDLSGFLVPDSASDEEILPVRSQRRHNDGGKGDRGDRTPQKCASGGREFSIGKEKMGARLIDLTSPEKEKNPSEFVCPESPPRFLSSGTSLEQPGQCSELDEPFSRLRFSPPRSKSPYKRRDDSRPVTPPSSPSKPRLHSPSKSIRIPPSPHRPSIDAFWSADVINDWNEQYSPKKVLKSPRKMREGLASVDNHDTSPSASPCRSPNKSPAKRDKQLIDQRKSFDKRKADLATTFLAEVDSVVGEGRVAEMAASTGGIQIIWSKKLSSTAGRANWRREAVRSKNVDGSVSTAIYRHHASIELAEKVIDDEDRLTNVIAHEYCHLANFMISGIKDNPHGASFKSWASKVTCAFGDRNVKVTTKHTYEIAYKYIWACSSATCDLEYKRHSKSIDPAKHSCGGCKSKLVQVQPALRKNAANGVVRRSEFQEFVKNHHEKVRTKNPGSGFGEIMAILGREYREGKKPLISTVDVRKGSKPIVEEVELVNGELADGDPDDVANQLLFLDLEG